MAKHESVQGDIAIMSDKGQVVIPASMRNRLGLKPRSKLLVFSMDDTIILKKLEVPDMKKELQQIWSKVDKNIAKYGEISEQEIQKEIERYRQDKRRK